eukprot:s1247_g32.t1
MSNFPPAYPSSFQRQPAMASARASEGVRPEDSASAVSWSHVSWNNDVGAQPNYVAPPVQEVPMQNPAPKAPPPGFRSGDAQGSADQSVDLDPDQHFPKDVQGFFRQAPAAPATQAAKALLGSAQLQAERLAKQKAQAKRRGQKGIRWGQMPGMNVQNSQNFQLPNFIQQLGAGDNERSVLVIDSRDKRIQSPFQGWLLDEILLNAPSGVNVLSDSQLVRSPGTGYHMNLFYVRILDGFKFILVGTMTSYGTVPAARWDGQTGKVLNHKAFQPFRWPMMADDSSTWVDVKVKVDGDLLLHLELRGYRSDHDMTVQLNYINDVMLANLRETLFVPSYVITVFQGWRVIATLFEVGGRLYACSEGGMVAALDYPLCHFEVRLTALSSADSIGMGADRLEFRFRSSGDKIDVSCSQVVVPSTWLVVSRVSGPTLVRNARWCREHHARIDGPDQTLQLSQLAGVHAHWIATIEAGALEETGPRVSAVAVESHPANLHLTCEAPLFRADKAIVPGESLALSAATVAGGSIMVPRRSLETRAAESLSEAAVTPQTFLDRVASAGGTQDPYYVPSRPVSYGPAPVIEEATDC